MHNRWQRLVVLVLALGAFGSDNNWGAEQSMAAAISTTTTTIQPPTTTEPTSATSTTNPGSGGPKEPNEPGSDEPTPEATKETVAEGDSIWTMAEANMPGEPTNQEVAEYVDQVEKTNRDRLRSGDPDLIEPGETIILPPVAAPAEPTHEADRNRHAVA